MRKLASANESETNRDSRSEERTDDLNDLLIENCLSFSGSKYVLPYRRDKRGTTRRPRRARMPWRRAESGFTVPLLSGERSVFCLRAVADLRTELWEFLRWKFGD